MLMGAVFERGVPPLAEAFEARADAVYGRKALAPQSPGSMHRVTPYASAHQPKRLQHRASRWISEPAEVAEAPLAHAERATAARCGGEMREPNGLLARAAARPGNAGDRHRDAAPASGARAPSRHRARAWSATDGAVALRSVCRRHAEHLVLGCVGVGDEAALQHVRGARRCRRARRRQDRRCRIRRSPTSISPRSRSACKRRSASRETGGRLDGHGAVVLPGGVPGEPCQRPEEDTQTLRACCSVTPCSPAALAAPRFSGRATRKVACLTLMACSIS